MRDKNMDTFPLFVYFYKEPPGKDYDKLYKSNIGFATLFNITYTYRTDSVIPFLDGKVIPKTSNGYEALQGQSSVEWKSVPKEIRSNILNRDISYKTKDILWMVSHCTTESRREDYVKKLQNKLSTLSIDILGKCGTDHLLKRNKDGETLRNTSISISNETSHNNKMAVQH